MRRTPIWKCIYLCSYGNVDRPAFILFLPSIPFYLRACIFSVHSNSLSLFLHGKRCKLRRFPVCGDENDWNDFRLYSHCSFIAFFTKYLSFCPEMHSMFIRRENGTRKSNTLSRLIYVKIHVSMYWCGSWFNNNFFYLLICHFQVTREWICRVTFSWISWHCLC